jgi:hypothetical protein
MIAVCKNAESYARKLEAKLSTVSALIALVLTAVVALIILLKLVFLKVIVDIGISDSTMLRIHSILRPHSATAVAQSSAIMYQKGAKRSAHDRKPQGHALGPQVSEQISCSNISYYVHEAVSATAADFIRL